MNYRVLHDLDEPRPCHSLDAAVELADALARSGKSVSVVGTDGIVYYERTSV